MAAEAIGRTEPHSKVVVTDQPKRLATMVASDRSAVRRGGIAVHSWSTVSVLARDQINFQLCCEFRHRTLARRQ